MESVRMETAAVQCLVICAVHTPVPTGTHSTLTPVVAGWDAARLVSGTDLSQPLPTTVQARQPQMRSKE